MTKRLILAVLFLTLGFLSLLPVLYVNNGFDLVEYGSKKSLGAPRIDVHVEDPCNSVKYVTATAEVTPFQSNFTVQSFPTEHPTCGEPAGAIVTLVDLALQLEGDTIDPSEFRPMKPHPNVTRGTPPVSG